MIDATDTPALIDDDSPLYLPTREDPATNKHFENALPCPVCEAGKAALWPLMSAEVQGVFAVSCTKCDYIGDHARTIEDAVTKWNDDATRKN